jgi:hypothetical protein
LGRRIFLLGALCAALLVGASGAGAASTFTDPAGDATGGAADLTQVVVSNDFDGNITFALTTNRSAFSDDDVVGILLNTDKNSSTGTAGVDYAIVLGNGIPVLLRANSTGFERAPGTLVASPNFMTVTVNRSDLGATTGFVFLVFSGLVSNDSAEDFAPDNGAALYDLDLKPVLDTLAAKFAPAKPKAGKIFRLAGTTLRLEDGTTVKADSITCVAKLNGKRLAGRCAWRMPKNAKGKRLVVTLTAHYKGATTTFTPWRFKVG